MAQTSIEWATDVWNPTTGCDRVSPGCDNCYALTMAKRLKGMGSAKYQRDGDPRTSGPGFGLTVHRDVLGLPLTWRKPRRVFVNSMSDLFHDQVPDEYIADVFAVMALAGQHTFQVLTKRHGRMRALLSGTRGFDLHEAVVETLTDDYDLGGVPEIDWPLPNVWLGVSVEDQKRADIRIPALLGTPAAVRWLSCEPLLGPVYLDDALYGKTYASTAMGHGVGGQTMTSGPHVDWVVVGGESGPGARPMHPDWARSLRDQCDNAEIPFFFKQWGGRTPKAAGRELDGRTWDEYPAGAR